MTGGRARSALMVVLMCISMAGIGQAHVGKNGKVLPSTIKVACKGNFRQGHTKNDGQTFCRGTVAGEIKAQGDNGTLKTCVAIMDPEWALGKAAEMRGVGPKKPKHNFIARVIYELPVDPTEPERGNGDFAWYGTSTKGNCYVQGTFEYIRVISTMVVTLPCKKTNTKCDKAVNDIAVGNGVQGADGMPVKDPNQIVCSTNPHGGGALEWVAKAVPNATGFHVQWSGKLTINCV